MAKRINPTRSRPKPEPLPPGSVDKRRAKSSASTHKPAKKSAGSAAPKPAKSVKHSGAKRPGDKVSGARNSVARNSGAKGAARRLPALRPWTTEEIIVAFGRFQAANPEPKGELEHLNPYTLLVAVVLSAQATDAGVNKATRNLFPIADTPDKMLALGEDQVREAIKTIGLFRTKARNVLELSRLLIENHGGVVPRSREALETLPGVGRKTANVVLNMAFGEPTIAVDTHVFRLGNRTGLAPGKTPLDVESGLERVIPDTFKRHAHHWLILHGRYVCVARKPLCERCVINDLCRWPEKTV